MLIRKKSSALNETEYEYLQIAGSRREGRKVRQEIITTLGRADKLVVDGKVDGLLRSLAKFSHKLLVVDSSYQVFQGAGVRPPERVALMAPLP
jgi:hypothetical protein